jgi:phosphoglycolate phosphatase-like HAD superfamily hydrolase
VLRKVDRGRAYREARTLVRCVTRCNTQEVVIDLDGTLVRLHMPWVEWIDAVTDLLPSAERERVRCVMATPGAAWGAELNRFLQADLVDYDEVMRVSAAFEANHEEFEVHEPLVDAIRAIARGGVRVLLWTSNTRATAERILIATGLDMDVSTIVGREDVFLGKPDLEGYRMLDPRADIDRQLFVGDSDNDRRAAAEAGVRFFLVRGLSPG